MAMSQPAKLVMTHIVLCALTLILVVVLGHSWVRLSLERHHDEQLRESAQQALDELGAGPLDEATVAAAVGRSGVESSLTFVVVRSAAGQAIYASPAFMKATRGQASPGVPVVDASSEPQLFTLTFAESPSARIASVPLSSGGGSLSVGIFMGDSAAWLHAVEYWSAILGPLLLIVTALAMWLLVGRGLAPGGRA